MTQELQQVALDFAREVLGWKNPQVDEVDRCVYEPNRAALYSERFLTYGDLNAVMESVRGWCDRHDRWLELRSFWERGWTAEVGLNGDFDGEMGMSHDACYALMAACVEAARKMQEVA